MDCGKLGFTQGIVGIFFGNSNRLNLESVFYLLNTFIDYSVPFFETLHNVKDTISLDWLEASYFYLIVFVQ